MVFLYGNPVSASLCSCLENVPEELREPFYTDQYDQEHIKPPVVHLLLSAELYCRAGSLILKSDAAKPLVGHDAVVQALAQKGLYVTDQERLVTERDLQRKPIQMSAHLAMIDTLMMAYTAEMVSVEKVIACAQRYSTFFQATDLPYDIEDAVMYWINKVNEHLKDILEQEQKLKEHHTMEAPGGQKSPSKWFWKLVPARYRKEQTLLRQLPCIPLVENLLKDGTDGCALAALIHFYCPGVVRLEDICLKETMSLADSLYNLQLVQEFCQEHLTQCCHFSLEDMLYAAASIKVRPPPAPPLRATDELFCQPGDLWKNQLVNFLLILCFSEPAVRAPDARASTLDSSQGPTSAEGDAFPHPHHLPSRHSRPQPPSSASGGIRRSSSMSYVDGFIGTWPKEKRSSVHGVSFDISFDKENTVPRGAPNRGLPRSVSNEGLSLNNNRASKTTRKSLSFKPVNGEGEAGSIEEELSTGPHGGFPTYVPHPPHKLNSSENTRYQLPNGALQPGLLLDELGSQVETPSIEEALQIIHDTEQRPLAPPPGHVANGFFLHSQDLSPLNANLQLRPPSPDRLTDTKGALSPVTDDTEVDTGIHVPSEDLPGTVDEDSSLRDYTVSLDSKNVSLIEVSLSDLKPPEKADVSVEKEDGDSDREQLDDEQKVCCGFFFKDDQKAEDDMALKRAALLEKRLRREKETQLRKQQLEAEMEHRKEETRRKTEEERQKKEDERARREFIRQEYLRRKQLKLMEDMDTVIKPRPPTAKQKKQRPKSMHRDHMEPPKTPTQGPPVSSLSLASLTTGDSESVQSGKRTPRSESVEGFLSPSRCGSRNGEKDWENASTTSSVASGTEYTGGRGCALHGPRGQTPRGASWLIRSKCRGSGRACGCRGQSQGCRSARESVTGPDELREISEVTQRPVRGFSPCRAWLVLQEMEKSDANNFLILFRDSGCQFRSLYTYCPETEDIAKLTGIGPKSISKKMIEGLYKYNSDRKQFSHIPAKTLSASVDAITIHSHLWQSKRPVTPKKLLPTKA
ncbi:PREDICTED: calmodulin-regulated spectrin-associated protein 2 [Myotis brandtii]|uniref:calmodulin-regulated spectrin-associated protein 2 n=1 Tax=Myotis brandtii TaxID=109478 RepID=UPI000703E1F2|nr:PREDICTED: calmodulin-regulated spectrin-associated protein 2 [Myotis brandtii]